MYYRQHQLLFILKWSPASLPASGACSQCGGIGIFSRPALQATMATPVQGKCSQCGEITILSRSVSEAPAGTPAQGTCSQFGEIGIASWPASSSTLTCATTARFFHAQKPMRLETPCGRVQALRLGYEVALSGYTLPPKLRE